MRYRREYGTILKDSVRYAVANAPYVSVQTSNSSPIYISYLKRLLGSLMKPSYALLSIVKYSVLGMVSLCKIKVAPKTEIAEQARLFQQLANLSSKDALHLACAVYIQADFFLTCDDSLRKKA